MEAASVRNIASGIGYQELFSLPKRLDPILKGSADVKDTVKLVKYVVKTYSGQTAKLAQILKGRTLHETCENIWNFVYRHIRYTRDAEGIEQVRTPARTWADRAAGVDCDCYTAFISSVLYNLGIAHTLRITEYSGKGYFQHIYPIVYKNGGVRPQPPRRDDYLVLDCVKDKYDDEQPFTNHEDFAMKIQMLDGIDDDVQGLEDFLLDGLGKVHSRRGRKVAAAPINPAAPETAPAANMVAPASIPAEIVAPPTMTRNYGMLKNGTKVELSDETIPGTQVVKPYSGSMQGKTVYNRKVLINGAWDGKGGLERFIVKNGELTGVNTKGWYFRDFGNGGGIQRIAGANIKNPGVALGAAGEETLDALFSIGSTGAIDTEQVPNRMGMFIPYAVLLSLYQSRFTGTKGAGGLETLGEMLGIQGLGDLQYQVLGLGDFETDGLDDINGLSGDDISIMGYEALAGLGAYLSGSSYEGESIALMDGLGRVRRAGIRRGHKITATPDAPQSAAAPAAPAEKKLGLYVPLNTLRNLFKLRAANLSRLQANGQTITSGSVPLSIDAMQVNGLMGNDYNSTDGLGWGWFNSMTANITNLASKAVNIASPMAQFLPGGSAISTLAKTGLSVINRVNGNGSGGNGNAQLSRTQPVSQLLPTSPGRDYTTVYGEESAREYNRSMATAGLGAIPTVDSVITFVKANPIPVAVAAGAVGLGVYHFWPKVKASGKASGKGAGKAKKSRGKTAQYNMMGMS